MPVPHHNGSIPKGKGAALEFCKVGRHNPEWELAFYMTLNKAPHFTPPRRGRVQLPYHVLSAEFSPWAKDVWGLQRKSLCEFKRFACHCDSFIQTNCRGIAVVDRSVEKWNKVHPFLPAILSAVVSTQYESCRNIRLYSVERSKGGNSPGSQLSCTDFSLICHDKPVPRWW